MDKPFNTNTVSHQSHQPIILLLDEIANRIEQFGTSWRYSPATPNPWRKMPISQKQNYTKK